MRPFDMALPVFRLPSRACRGAYISRIAGSQAVRRPHTLYVDPDTNRILSIDEEDENQRRLTKP